VDLSKLSDSERLMAEQAVLTLRALEQAAATAPHGKGLATLEAVIHDKGFEHLRNMLSVACAAPNESAPCAALSTVSSGSHFGKNVSHEYQDHEPETDTGVELQSRRESVNRRGSFTLRLWSRDPIAAKAKNIIHLACTSSATFACRLLRRYGRNAAHPSTETPSYVTANCGVIPQAVADLLRD
jgi:hypothetical protein